MRLPFATIALAVLNFGLLTAVAIELVRGSQRDELLESSAQASASAHTSFDVPDLSASLESMQNQAVFHESRAFYVAAAPAVDEQPVPDYRLTGSMSLPNQPMTAILINNQTNARIKVSTGDELEGWRVADIGPKHITVRLGDRTAEIGSARTQSPGITAVSGGQGVIAPRSTGIARVPVAENGIRPVTAPPSGAPNNEAPRLYRPPGS